VITGVDSKNAKHNRAALIEQFFFAKWFDNASGSGLLDDAMVHTGQGLLSSLRVLREKGHQVLIVARFP
jgi:hypothetical protein